MLDSGGILSGRGASQKLVAELSLKSMNLIGYSAMNMGWNELSMGTDFLKEITSTVSFPIITSNLVHKDSRLPLGKKYIIKRVGDIRVGILGIMPSHPSENISYKGGSGCASKGESITSKDSKEIPFALFMEHLEVIPPEDALKHILPELRTQADLVVLLSQYNFEATKKIVSNVKGIDVVISSIKKTWGNMNNTNTDTLILQVPYQGRHLGYIQLTLNDTGKILQHDEKMMKLNDIIQSDVQIAQITGNDINKRILEEEQRKMEEEAKALLKLTPYEYYEKIVKEQESKSGGTK